MRVGIICAGDREVAPFLPMIHDCKMTEKAMLKFYEGKISDVEVVVLFSGVCKVNAAIATQILIDTYHVNRIINAGTAGELVNDDRIEAKKSMLDAYENLRGMYDENDDNTQVLYIKNAVATFSSFVAPEETIRF